MATVVMLALVTLLLGGALLHSYISANRLARCSWEELLAQLHRIETDGITAVAMNHLAPGKDQLTLQPEDMWNLLGGLEGLQRMRENGRILIALARMSSVGTMKRESLSLSVCAATVCSCDAL